VFSFAFFTISHFDLCFSTSLSKGDPSAFLPIVSFTFTSFSPPFAKQLLEDGLELTGKTDLRFTDTLYKVLRDVFHYKPILTKQQFLQWGFSLRKISVTCDIINLVLQKHNQLKKPKGRCPATHKDDRGEAHPAMADADTNEGQVITISRESWENLMSRVLLLETKQDLSNIQLSVPPPCPLSASSCSSSSMSDVAKEDLKDRLERITNMLKSTSSLLKNTESSTAHCT
ncbi:hypothetical protein FQN60_012529, partial [Etheostoma spectabile]